MLKLEILRWSIVSGLAAALLRWPSRGSPFWAITIGRPFVLTRVAERSRFWSAMPV